MQTVSLDYYRYVEELLKPRDIHEKQEATNRAASNGLALILSIVLTLVHGILLYLMVDGAVGTTLPLIIHGVISAVLLIWAFVQFRAGGDSPFLLLLAISTTFMGVFGAIGTLLSVIMYGFFRQNATSFMEWFSLIFPPDLNTPSEEVYNKIIVGIDENPKDYEVMPFIDVMELGSEDQKRRALSKMTMKFSPRLAPALHKGLRDKSNAIRVQAATSVAKIEAEFMEKLEMIERAREREPDNKHLLFALAKYYDDYAYTGLLEREREALNRVKAIETYKAYLEHDPSHNEAWASIGRLLFRNQQWVEAAEWFRNAMERGWTARPMILWYMECLFKLGDFTMLRKIAREHGQTIVQNDDVPKEVRESIALWAS